MTEEKTPAGAQPEAASEDGAPDLSAVSPEDFAALIAAASDEQLAEAMAGPGREPALREIFARMAEHLDPQKAKGQDAVVHFQILGRPDGGHDHFELVLRDGSCEVSETPREQPRLTLTLDAVAFLKLITNQVSGPELFMGGKLKIDGDLMFASQMAALFRIPTAPKQEGSN
jgi:putative sterol carrier protein